MVRRGLAARVIGQRLGTGQVADQRPANQLDHRRQRRTLVPTKGEHRATVEHHVRVGARLPLGIHAPAFGDGLAGAPMQLDVAARNRAGGKVEHERVGARTRPAERDGVGAKYRLAAPGRRHPGMAGVARQRHQAGLGQLFDLDPQRRKVHAVVDGQGRDAVAAGLGLQHRHAGLERQLREAASSIHTHDRGRLVDHLRLGRRRHLAGLERVNTADHPVQPMGGAAIALPGDHRGRHGCGVRRVETVVQQDRLCQFMGLGKGQSNHGQLLGQTVHRAPSTGAGLDRFGPRA